MKAAVQCFLFAAAIVAAPAAAQNHALPAGQVAVIKRGLEEVYSLDYAKARKTFEGLIAANRDDPAGYAYLAFALWAEELNRKQELSIDRFASSDFFSESMRYRASVAPEVEARFMETSENAIRKARERLHANPTDKAALFIAGLAFQNIASFEASRRNWWAAFRNGSHTHRYHRELLALDPGFPDTMLSLGVSNYVAGSLPWKVKWVALLLGYRGSKTRGKEQLETAASKGVLVADNARVILALIYARERNYQRSFDIMAGLHKRFPDNFLLQLDMGGLALAMENAPRAIEIYEDVLRKRQARQGNYAGIDERLLYNRMGVAYRHRKDYRVASQWFQRSLSSGPPDENAATVARLELAKTLDLMGRREEALSYYRQVADAEDYAGSQKEARELMSRAFRP